MGLVPQSLVLQCPQPDATHQWCARSVERRIPFKESANGAGKIIDKKASKYRAVATRFGCHIGAMQ
jgi:hypothetical protein